MTPDIKDALAAAWRKIVAVGVGWFLTWLMRRWNIVLDANSSQDLVMGVVAVTAAIYGALINFLELHVPWLGWFLGLARQPKFVDQKTVPPRTLDGQPV
jgi:hypothetical protein